MRYEPYKAWTVWDQMKALDEGWGILTRSVDFGESYRDHPPILVSNCPCSDFVDPCCTANDDAAWRLVLEGGTPLHERALEFLKFNNTAEYEAIMRFKEDLDDDAAS